MDDPLIFISYRRRDVDLYVADKLHDHLSGAFGEDRIFLDTEAIPLGSDWRAFIDTRLSQSAAMLAIIGPTWVAEKHRLHDPDDMVRYELAKAITDPGITVIPILVDNTAYPSADDLPDDLRDLPKLNGTELLQRYFDHIVEDRLLPSLRKLLPAGTPKPRHATPHREPLSNMDIAFVQTHLARQGFDPGAKDGKFGPATRKAVREFQDSRGLPADGIPGPQTVKELARRKARSMAEIQRRLIALGFDTGAADGELGPATKAAIRRYQASQDLDVDGIVGPSTLKHLFDE